MRLALLVTSRCNATCTHCTTDSSPQKTMALGELRIKRLMDDAAALREAGEPLLFCISGGEAFVDFEKLVRIVAHGTSLGGRVTCTTNGFWASSDDKAMSRLSRLRDAGLKALGVSTSRFHQRFVNVDRVVRALRTARDLGIETVLKCAITRSDAREAWVDSLVERARPDHVESFPVVPYLRRGESLPESEYLREPGVPVGKCPASMLTVREDGRAYTCCNPGGFSGFLELGPTRPSGLESTYDRYLMRGPQQILRRHGPAYFAKEIARRGLGAQLRAEYADVCDLCAHIASVPALSAVAEETGRRYQVRQLRQSLRKFVRPTGRPRRQLQKGSKTKEEGQP